jgi:hypothetical protein
MYHAETADWLEHKRREFEDLKTRLAHYGRELDELVPEIEAGMTDKVVESVNGYRILLDVPTQSGTEWLADQAAFQAFVAGDSK